VSMSRCTPLRSSRRTKDDFAYTPVRNIVDETYVATAISENILRLEHRIEINIDKQMSEFRAIFAHCSRSGRGTTLDDADNDMDDDDFPELRTKTAPAEERKPLCPNPDHLTPSNHTPIVSPPTGPPRDNSRMPFGTQPSPPATSNPEEGAPFRYDRAAQAQAGIQRQLMPSISRYYDPFLSLDKREVRWLDSDLAGP
jgi:hypothetical protein